MKYEPVIGLEAHVQLNTRTKMFCDSLNDPEEVRPNVNVCPVCLGHPGTLPVPNIEAVKKVVKVGLALGANIRELSWFERKNYFYPDLPKGYQISQYEAPLCEGGGLTLASGKAVSITRVHLEEDTGKLIHESGIHRQGGAGRNQESGSLVDFNRAGVPLMELVTEPDLSSADEAKEFGEELQLLLRYLGVSGAYMEKGQLRIEANLSVRLRGEKKFGTKVELKNINSFRAVQRAIEYEVKRQSELLAEGKTIEQETRGWSEAKGKTFPQRTKEESHDYRYFPEPDIPPVRLSGDTLEAIKGEIVELPQQRRKRFAAEYGLKGADARIFTVQKELGDYFEKVASELKAESGIKNQELRKVTQLSANYLITELQKHVADISTLALSPENFAELVLMTGRGEVSSSGAQALLAEMIRRGDADPSQLVEELGVSQVSDVSALERAACAVVKAHPKAVEDFKKGKEASLKFLVGQVMKKTKGAANPQAATEALRKILTKS